MNSPIRMGILGAGRVARYALVEPARHVPDVAVTAIAARDPARARDFAVRYGIDRAHDSYADLISDPTLDAVYVALPNSLHAPWALRALASGKHVLCEKPLASNAREADALVRAAAACGRVFAEAMHYRYHPLTAHILQLAARLGRLRFIEVWNCFPVVLRGDIRYRYDLAGGALMDLGCYAVDLLLALAPGEPEVRAAHARLSGSEVDRWLRADLVMGGQVAARITCSMWSTMLWRSEARIVGERGALRVRDPFASRGFREVTIRSAGKRVRERPPRCHTSFRCQLEAFVTAIKTGGTVATSAAAGAATMRVIDAIYAKAGMRNRGS